MCWYSISMLAYYRFFLRDYLWQISRFYKGFNYYWKIDGAKDMQSVMDRKKQKTVWRPVSTRSSSHDSQSYLSLILFQVTSPWLYFFCNEFNYAILLYILFSLLSWLSFCHVKHTPIHCGFNISGAIVYCQILIPSFISIWELTRFVWIKQNHWLMIYTIQRWLTYICVCNCYLIKICRKFGDACEGWVSKYS